MGQDKPCVISIDLIDFEIKAYTFFFWGGGGGGGEAKTTKSFDSLQIFIWKALSQKLKVGGGGWGKSIHFLKAALQDLFKH